MAVQLVTTTEQGGRVIENPSSGKRIAIRQPPPDRSSRLSWELYLAPGGRVPSSHVHPRQEEVFRVVSGRVRFRLGVRRIVAGPGDTVHVPARTVHHFANAGPEEAHISVETEPPWKSSACSRSRHHSHRTSTPKDVAERYRDHAAVVAWQVEHEALDPLGLEHSWRLSGSLSTPNWPPYGRRTRPGPS